jgi:mono/diheme cytochrome c family protein
VKSITRSFTCVLLAILAGVLGASDAFSADDRPDPDPAAGRAAYELHCARCHGVTGKADGFDAKRLHPRPRDLTSGTFKIRTTASGTVPTDEDLYRTLDHGLTAGNMPDWSHLDSKLRWQIVYYLKTLSTNFQDNPPQPVEIGADPGRAANVVTGRQVYEKLGCAACHGPMGRGNGTSGPSMTDDWGMAIRPANLTQGWNYRGGAEPRDIATRMLTGIDGAQMPSYAEAATTEETWHLSYYVRSLQEPARWATIVDVPRVDGVPTTIDDSRWADATRTDVRLRNVVNAAGEMANPPTTSAVTLKALRDDASISFLVTWDDPTEDRTPESPDMLAVALRPIGLLGDVVSLQYWPMDDAPALDLMVWSAARSADPASAQFHEVLADRWEPVVGPHVRGTPRPAQVSYQDGRWAAIVVRPLAPGGLDGRAAQLGASARFDPVGFVVWDGGNNSQRAVSIWIDLALGGKDAAPHAEHAAVSDSEATAPAKPAGRRVVPLVAVAAGLILLVALKLALKK